MTPTMIVTIVIAACTISATLIGLLVAVLVAIRRDSINTGKVSEQVSAFSVRLLKFENDREQLAAQNDSKIAKALEASNAISAQRDQDILAAVRGFRATVDELKAEFAAIKNMWAGERKLVDKIRLLELELTKIRTEHDRNHPHESGPISIVRQDGAPRHPSGRDDGGDE